MMREIADKLYEIAVLLMTEEDEVTAAGHALAAWWIVHDGSGDKIIESPEHRIRVFRAGYAEARWDRPATDEDKIDEPWWPGGVLPVQFVEDVAEWFGDIKA